MKKHSTEKRHLGKWIIVIIVLISVILLSNLGVTIYNKINNMGNYDVMTGAIQEGDVQALKTVLEKGADTEYVPGNKWLDIFSEKYNRQTVLQKACYEGNIEAVKLLVENGADVNFVKSNAQYSPLMCAIAGRTENDLEIVKYLIENGADVNYDCSFRTAIWSVFDRKKISENGLEILKCLVDAGADIYKYHYLGEACFWKHEDLIWYLVDECDYIIDDGHEIRMYCKGVNEYSIDTIELLIAHGADIYEKDNDEKNAIDYLREEENVPEGLIEAVIELAGQ